MDAEHPPPDPQISVPSPPPAAATTTTAAPSPEAPPIDHASTASIAAASNPPKRQRRPSVRLGEIGGDPPYDAQQRRPNRTWRFHKDPSQAAKTSKTRPITNLVNGATDSNFPDSENYADSSHRKSKIRRPAKRARTNWNRFDSSAAPNGNAGGIESSNFLQQENENNAEQIRELEAEDSETPLLRDQQSPINSAENMGLQYWDEQRRGNGVHHNEINSPEKDTEENYGVREWLIGLGLGRYVPVFEIHEVDEEVLPLLTLEDLKDMGINAVGSRRKMYSAILKLKKDIGSKLWHQ
ncbi:uncharacterized protein LOC127241431 [Andrographis paniculata]|uniref:uncharacterized protein LOC127241431 n=1 Tax=Andrographis paniculata TaxID=175694 RepID=UPI0021E7B497|nr:uncharacterized protein LOC127241431 [Andrographis paniculata]